jgi:hypothetical protein
MAKRKYSEVEIIGALKKKYNEERPHSSLGYVAPAVFDTRRIHASTACLEAITSRS